ncbi:MAG: hypothetical protein K2H06_05950, partial [Anaeroplasmataceae bacterium]|nr:hypothetical protein [Anaeroplasmataceae bacterium]
MQDNNQKQNQQQGPGRKFDWKFPLIVIIAIVGIFLFVRYLMQPNPKQLSFAELETAIVDTQNPVDSSTVKAQPASGSNNESIYIISGKFKDGKSFTCYVTIQQFNEITTGENALSIRLYKLETNIFLSLIISLIPYVIMIGFFIFLFRSQGNGKAFDFGKSTARLTRGKSVTFDDVAGCDEEKEELVEIIDFLKNPRKYSEIGARIPKGVLLV